MRRTRGAFPQAPYGWGALTLAVATVVALLAPTADATTASQEWPMYGADLANSRTVAGGPAPASVASLAEAWRLDVTDGDFTGTPVVSGGAVFVGSNGGVVRALDAATGAVKWSTSVAPDPINGSAAVTNGTVFVPVAKQGGPYVLALDAATGRTLWSHVLDTSPAADVYGSPTVAPLGDGRSVVLVGVSAVVGDPDTPLRGSVVALDTRTGRRVWKSYMVDAGFNGAPVWSTPAVDVASRTVYVGTGNAYSGAAAPQTDAIVKLSLATGARLGWFQATAGDVFSSDTPGLDVDFGASPNLFEASGRTLVGEGQKSGTYWALDRQTMTPGWSTPLGVPSALGGILGSTAYDAGTGRIVGPMSVPGYVWSVDAATGLPAWVTAGVGDVAHLSPVAISNGVVYSVLSTGFLVAWREKTGTLLTQLPLTPGTLVMGSGVSIAGGTVFADTGSQGANGSVVAFRAPSSTRRATT